MIETKFVMSCGCKLTSKELTRSDMLLVCPVHGGCIVEVHKLCRRCSKLMISPRSSSKKIYCDDCNRTLDHARTVYNFHNLSEFIDPILWRKTVDENIEDVSANIMAGYEAIQIDLPRQFQHEEEKIVINIKNKISILKKTKELLMPKMIKDCRTCVKSNDCQRPIECCVDGKFPYWKGKITGKIIKTTSDAIHVRNDIDNMVYILERFSQSNVGSFDVFQDSQVSVESGAA